MFNSMFGSKKREETKSEKKSDFEIEEEDDLEQGTIERLNIIYELFTCIHIPCNAEFLCS